MIKKINTEIDEFTNTIKETKGCDDMLAYMNSNIYASIKLLMFASKTFSLFGKIMLFFIISLTGLLLMSSLTIGSLNSTLLLIDIILFILILAFVMQYKKSLILSIENKKSSMET